MTTIKTDLSGLKRMGKDFLDALPTATPEEAEAGWKCFGLAYLGTETTSESEDIQAAALFRIMSRKMLEYEIAHGIGAVHY